ncbi:alpha/beta hydrolase [Roseobacter sp. HKCCA0434]|uniref:alpha/beta fold hydrolase n=1 Tax=Roseobacter sp. HKCCA0434 TaxID=3079297 RepID=UPI002905C995|nr:alpha/beta hydrolase [Roseobacter sp. HKCCA0434]
MIEERFIEIDGARTRVRSAGPQGAPVLVFLHGFPEWSGAFDALMTALPSYRGVAFDQRGFGISRNPAPDLTGFAMKHLLSDLATVISEEGGGPVVLVGHDWGAAVAYAAAFAMPDLVSHLVIFNGVHPTCFQRALSAGGAQSQASRYIDWLRAEGVEDTLRADDFAKLTGLFSAHMDMSWMTPELRAEYVREWSRPNAVEGMVSWYRVSPVEVAPPGQPRPLPDWAKVEMPVSMPHLLIWGTGDTALLPEATEGLDALCDDLERVDLDGCDHWLHHQRPEAVAQAIDGWLRRKS